MNDEQHDELGWHVISGTHLLELLRRAGTEDADILFAELWANAEHVWVK